MRLSSFSGLALVGDNTSCLMEMVCLLCRAPRLEYRFRLPYGKPLFQNRLDGNSELSSS